MPQYNDLSANEQAAADELVQLHRRFAIELRELALKARAAHALWFSVPPGSSTTLADLISNLDTGALLPNRSSLAGADEVTKTAVATVAGYVETLAGFDSNNHLEVLLPFAGSVNLTPTLPPQ